MTIHGATLNSSAHTLGDLRTLAQNSPAEAETYLRGVATSLQRSQQSEAASAIAALLNQTGSLVDRIAQNSALRQIFPANAGEWGALQTARAGTVGWEAITTSDRPINLKGTVTLEGSRLQLTTTGGRTYALAASSLQTFPWMGQVSMMGVMSDGPLSLQGTLSQDGTTFNVEGFALNRDGRYDTFTYGRAQVVDDQVTLNTPRGIVQIADPEFRAKIKAMPSLGVILPGEPTVKPDGTMTYEGNPEKFFGLGRFMQTVVNPSDAEHPQPYVLTDMAYSHFRRKPSTIPPGSESRVNHNGRVWLEGTVHLDGNGVPQNWVSSYVGTQADANLVALPAAAGPIADPIQAAVITTEV
jgi:hypothetical protein